MPNDSAWEFNKKTPMAPWHKFKNNSKTVQKRLLRSNMKEGRTTDVKARRRGGISHTVRLRPTSSLRIGTTRWWRGWYLAGRAAISPPFAALLEIARLPRHARSAPEHSARWLGRGADGALEVPDSPCFPKSTGTFTQSFHIISSLHY